jgi:hypothetical protein
MAFRMSLDGHTWWRVAITSYVPSRTERGRNPPKDVLDHLNAPRLVEVVRNARPSNATYEVYGARSLVLVQVDGVEQFESSALDACNVERLLPTKKS